MSARHHHKLDKMSGYVKIVRWRSFSILLYTWSVSLFLIPFNLRSREMWNGPNWGKFERKLYRFDQLLSPFSLNSLLSRIFFFFFTFLCRIKSFSFFLIFFRRNFQCYWIALLSATISLFSHLLNSYLFEFLLCRTKWEKISKYSTTIIVRLLRLRFYYFICYSVCHQFSFVQFQFCFIFISSAAVLSPIQCIQSVTKIFKLFFCFTAVS